MLLKSMTHKFGKEGPVIKFITFGILVLPALFIPKSNVKFL